MKYMILTCITPFTDILYMREWSISSSKFKNMTWILYTYSCLLYVLFVNICPHCTSLSDFLYAPIWNGYLHIPTSKITSNEWRRESQKSSDLITKTHTDSAWRSHSRASAVEDIWLYERLFYGVQYGFVVESGAGNGIQDSVSYFFEAFANWTALLVEPDPMSFEQILENRTNAISINVGLCAEPSMLKFVRSATPTRHGFVDFMPATYKRRFHKSNEAVLTIPCIPVQAILDKLQITKVDLWIIDTEGAEENTLRGIDFGRVTVSVIIIDAELHPQLGSTSRFDYLRQFGFRCHSKKWNVICINDNLRKSASTKLIFT